MKVSRRLLQAQRGMTLIEILAVVVIIALIMGIVMKNVGAGAGKAKADLNKVKLEALQPYLSMYRDQAGQGKFPSTLQELVTPTANWTPPIKPDGVIDVYQNPFLYKVGNGGRSYVITSYGDDGVAGGVGSAGDQTVQGP